MPYSGPSGTTSFDNFDDTRAAATTALAREVAALRRTLLSAELAPLEACLPRLEQATAAFRDAFREAPRVMPRPELRRDLKALRGDLKVIAGLAQSGEALYRGMARWLGAARGGYTPQGDGAALQTSGSLLVRG